jgi:hypothetical protein
VRRLDSRAMAANAPLLIAGGLQWNRNKSVRRESRQRLANALSVAAAWLTYAR